MISFEPDQTFSRPLEPEQSLLLKNLNRLPDRSFRRLFLYTVAGNQDEKISESLRVFIGSPKNRKGDYEFPVNKDCSELIDLVSSSHPRAMIRLIAHADIRLDRRGLRLLPAWVDKKNALLSKDFERVLECELESAVYSNVLEILSRHVNEFKSPQNLNLNRCYLPRRPVRISKQSRNVGIVD